LEDQEKYIKDLEDTIRKFLKPLNDVPFRVAMKAVSGHDVIPFDENDDGDKQLLQDLIKAATAATKDANEAGIFTTRPNEVGNHIEPFVVKALRGVGLDADKPETGEGEKKAVGYPDIFIRDRKGRPNYLECKTYNRNNYQTTQRSFYFSPAPTEKEFKVRYDARHLIISFEIERAKRGGNDAYVPVHWKIFKIDNMIGQIKHEFNSSNRQMYRKEALLAEG
jgi:hypothetical protein